jgi:hypothetical protein
VVKAAPVETNRTTFPEAAAAPDFAGCGRVHP